MALGSEPALQEDWPALSLVSAACLRVTLKRSHLSDNLGLSTFEKKQYGCFCF